jgi:hypothetical protein
MTQVNIDYKTATEEQIRAEVHVHRTYLKDPGAGRDVPSRTSHSERRIHDAREELKSRGIELDPPEVLA